MNIGRYLELFIFFVYYFRIFGIYFVIFGVFFDEVVVCSLLVILFESRLNNFENRNFYIYYIYNKLQNYYCINSIIVIMDFFMIFIMIVFLFNDFEIYMYMEEL